MSYRMNVTGLVGMVLMVYSFCQGAANDNWTNVTPSDFSLSSSLGYGANTLVADPSNKAIVYVGGSKVGIWRSTDYGKTWAHWNQTVAMDSGNPSMTIASDGSYILSRLMYPTSSFLSGSWKSTDGGINWTRYAPSDIPAGDADQIWIDPYDKTRAVLVSHYYGSTDGHMYESIDAGETWTDMGMPGTAHGPKLSWIDNDHILAILADGDAAGGPMLGTRSGSTWPWAWSWSVIPTTNATIGNKCPHGGSLIVIDTVNKINGKPVLFIPGLYGVDKGTYDTNGKLSLTRINNSNGSVMVATPTTLYSTASFAINTGNGYSPNLMHAARAPGTTWIQDATPTAFHIGSYQNGWAQADVTFDGTNYIIIAACFNAGIWRYVEPASPTSMRTSRIPVSAISAKNKTLTFISNRMGMQKNSAGQIRNTVVYDIKGKMISKVNGSGAVGLARSKIGTQASIAIEK